MTVQLMVIWIFALAVLSTLIAFTSASIWIWVLFLALSAFSLVPGISDTLVVVSGLIFILLVIPLHYLPLRRKLLSRPMLGLFGRLMPKISDTEREALEAGTTWWDADLFSGRPDWRKLRELPAPDLADEEQAFLDGPVEELCRTLNDWQVTAERLDLPEEAWTFLKEKGFFGMIIPKGFGGLGFSAQAHSAVIVKLVSRGIVPAVTAMVPNSLGPGQLLLNYGTKEQQEYYLPRLAKGEEVPCFALTSSHAGSDAAAMLDRGVVEMGEFDGKMDVLGIRLNWDKRYITLAPVATLLGLAFKLADPKHLLGGVAGEEDLGITLALIPTSLPGVEIGQRHLPLNQPFMNGPTRGRDVFIPIDYIIGGRDYAGQGWRMLMECLADGRAISLPSLAAGTGKLASRATGAYCRIRKQFKQPIGRFEGIEEALARIGGHTYGIEAVRAMTSLAVDLGEKPSVISAIAKYHCTERMRKAINHAMDIFGGTAICLGPRNLLGRFYESIPIAITVEGANILTRSLIIFGQGVIRSHPYLLKEMKAVAMPNKQEALEAFDQAFFGHVGFATRNFFRTLVLGFTNGFMAFPDISGRGRRYACQVTRLSSALALVADVALLVLGGTLKRRERLSARLGDVLSELYFVSAAIKHFNDQEKPATDEPFLDWVCQDALFTAQMQLAAFLDNFPSRLLATILRLIVFPLGLSIRPPSDRLDHRVASLLLIAGDARDRLTHGIHVNSNPDDPLGRIEFAFEKVVGTAALEERVRRAEKNGQISGRDEQELIDKAFIAGVLSFEEAERLKDTGRAVMNAVAVDEFGPGEL